MQSGFLKKKLLYAYCIYLYKHYPLQHNPKLFSLLYEITFFPGDRGIFLSYGQKEENNEMKKIYDS